MDYKIKDISLAEQGFLQLEWAETHMPALINLRNELSASEPLNGTKITAVLHVTKETGVLARALIAAGAALSLAASNPLSTQDDIAAALAKEGVKIFAWRGSTNTEYYENIEQALKINPDLLLDDGADLHTVVLQKHAELGIIGGTEETTTGVTRLKAMESSKKLRYPIIAVNNAYTKYLFDNRYGTGQSTVDGILRATNILIAGKCAVVAGYGWVGRGIAMRLQGLGARVIVTEINPLKALEAVMDGYEVLPMEEAAKEGEIFVTATGNKAVIREEHIKCMKSGSVLANSGHFDVEIDLKGLENVSMSKRKIREQLTEYTLKNANKVYLIAEGRLANLGAAEGHPSEVMDLSFSNQFLSAVYLVRNKGKLAQKVYDVFPEIDERVAKLKLSALNINIDVLTPEQKKYIEGWEEGTS